MVDGYQFARLQDYKAPEVLYYPVMDQVQDHSDDMSVAGLNEHDLNQRRLHRLARSKVSELG